MEPDQIKYGELTDEQMSMIRLCKSDEARVLIGTLLIHLDELGEEYDGVDAMKPHTIGFLQGRRAEIKDQIEVLKYWRDFDLDAAKKAEDREETQAQSLAGPESERI